MNPEEAIQMLEILRDNCFEGFSVDGKPDTIIHDVKHTSFTWVIEEAIKLLKKSPNIIEQLTLSQQKVMKIMKEEPTQDHLLYQGGFVEGLDLAIKLVKKEIEND